MPHDRIPLEVSIWSMHFEICKNIVYDNNKSIFVSFMCSLISWLVLHLAVPVAPAAAAAEAVVSISYFYLCPS